MFPLGRSSRGTIPLATGSLTFTKTIGIIRVSRWTATVARVAFVTMMSGCKPTLPRERPYLIGVSAPPMKVHTHVAAIGPTQVRKRLRERGEASLRLGIIFVVRHEHADASHPLARLRARCDRPNRGAPEPRDEIPPFHSITRSARARKASGIVTPIAFAVTY